MEAFVDIKKANVGLLLEKVAGLLQGLPDDAKASGEFSEAQKALAQLQGLFAGQDGEIELLACKSSRGPVVDR
jgi:hypothetical protein